MSAELCNILNNFKDVPVREGFIKHRKEQWELGYSKAEIQLDAQLLEWFLASLNLVDKTESIKNDFRFQDMFVDIKEVNNKWFNVGGKSGNKKKWWTSNMKEGELTHFLFIKTDRDQSKLLEVGDNVNIEKYALWPAKNIINELKESNFGGYYMDPKKIWNNKWFSSKHYNSDLAKEVREQLK